MAFSRSLLIFFVLPISGCTLLGISFNEPMSLSKYSNYHNEAAFYYYKEGNFDAAIAELNRVFEWNQGDTKALHLMGMILYKQEMYENALDYFSRSVRLEPDNALYHTSLGLAYDKLGKSEEALPHHLFAIKKEPDLAMAHNNISYCYYNLGKYDLAWKHLTKAESLNYQVKSDFVKKVRNAMKVKQK